VSVNPLIVAYEVPKLLLIISTSSSSWTDSSLTVSSLTNSFKQLKIEPNALEIDFSVFITMNFINSKNSIKMFFIERPATIETKKPITKVM